MLNSISVDVEEYFHAANLEAAAPPSAWHRLPRRVEKSTERVLEVFARNNVRGTFFILGCVARRHPQLVRNIAAGGHEIASHGYSHRLAFSQTPKQFLRDIRRAKLLLEDITAQPVIGYRAPNFSIRSDNRWAYDALLEAGYVYDSSVYPTWHPRYANQHMPVESFRENLRAGHIFVFPLAVARLPFGTGELRLPAAGGAYWRVLPRWYSTAVLRSLESSGRKAFHCYFHPWELDAEQPVFPQLSFLTKFRHYGGAEKFEGRLEHFLRSFSFAPLREVAIRIYGEEFTRAGGASA